VDPTYVLIIVAAAQLGLSIQLQNILSAWPCSYELPRGLAFALSFHLMFMLLRLRLELRFRKEVGTVHCGPW
jgi:hypothetical protein